MAKTDLPNIQDVSRVPDELLPVLHWWQDKGPKTLAIVGAAVLAAALVLYAVRRREATTDEALLALSIASQAEDFEAIATDGGKVAPIARLDQARALYAAGDYEGALAVYETAMKEIDDPALADIAKMGHVCALEALGRLEEALAEVTALEGAFAASTTPHYLAAEALFAHARILCQQGDKAAAKAVLAPVLTAAEGTALAKYTPQAERLVKMIDAYTQKGLFEQAAELAPAPAAPEAK